MTTGEFFLEDVKATAIILSGKHTARFICHGNYDRRITNLTISIKCTGDIAMFTFVASSTRYIKCAKLRPPGYAVASMNVQDTRGKSFNLARLSSPAMKEKEERKRNK